MSELHTEVLTELERFGENTKAVSHGLHTLRDSTQSAVNNLANRIESIESLGNRPSGNTRKANPGFSEHKSATGESIYELKSTTRLADVFNEPEPEISFGRWLAGALIPDFCDKEAAEYAAHTKQIATTTTGVSIPTQYMSQWIDDVRTQSVLNSAGVTTSVMPHKVQTHMAVTADPTASWHTEAGSISAANPTFEARSLTSTTLVTRCTASLEATQDSPDFGTQLAEVMSRSMAREVDRAGLIGSGTPPEPQGLLGATGVNTVTGVGTPTDYSELITGVGRLVEDSVPLDVATRVAIMDPHVWAVYAGLKTGISSDNTPLVRPAALSDTRFLIAPALPLASPQDQTIFLGDFSEYVFGVRREASVEALKLSSYAGNLIVEFIGYLRCDWLVRRPKSFCNLTGVTI